jgi:F-type H+-transporting ATPase subunit b
MLKNMPKKLPIVVTLAALLALARPSLADAPQAQPGLLSFDPASAIWVLVSFTLVLIILYKTAWKNVLESLHGREARIQGSIRQAEEAQAKAEAALKEHAARLAGAEEQIRQMLGKATADAEKIAANIRAQTQAENEAERESTRKEIEAAKRDAIRQVYEQTADLATTVASRIIGRNLNPQDQQDLVKETLGQLQEMGRP